MAAEQTVIQHQAGSARGSASMSTGCIAVRCQRNAETAFGRCDVSSIPRLRAPKENL